MYYGLHGTSKTRARQIRTEGFRTGKGRVGTGVYFWRKGPHDQDLARAWHSFMAPTFAGDMEPGVAILSCAIRADSEEVIDLESPEMKDFVYEMSIQYECIGPRPDEEKLSGLYDWVLSEVEATHPAAIVMLIARVAAPRKNGPFEYPVRLLGAPISYIVRVVDRIDVLEELT